MVCVADAKALYSQRIDIQSLEEFPHPNIVAAEELADAVQRLKLALELRPVSSIATLLEEIHLPDDLAQQIIRDFAELREAAALGLAKTVLLLAGLVAESLLLTRHPDQSERGPGLGVLVKQAREQRLFGRDTLRHLDNLIDYRDLIHPRSEVRNRIEPIRLELSRHSLQSNCCVRSWGMMMPAMHNQPNIGLQPTAACEIVRCRRG